MGCHQLVNHICCVKRLCEGVTLTVLHFPFSHACSYKVKGNSSASVATTCYQVCTIRYSAVVAWEDYTIASSCALLMNAVIMNMLV